MADQLRLAVLAIYDQLFGLELADLAVDGCTTKAPCGGGQTAGPSPVDRRKQGLKRSVAVEAGGIPLAALAAPANHRDDGLLAATLDALGAVGPLPAQPVVHLDAGYDDQPCRQVLTKRRRLVVEFWLALASAAIICGRLVRRAWTHYRWDNRPRRRP